ncbi:hypothetical protein CMI47_13290 [Candidatus Pacearchaeota archaeon]|nr:hypothetical protein [Candidatus Pacearchaeota archaeon]|tara:strand:+ start:1528 stop:1881 length:354 start_codon:yes stop_codon:yes gene_type:complete
MFKLNDTVQFNPNVVKGTKEELFTRYGEAIIISNEYTLNEITDSNPRKRFHSKGVLHRRNNISPPTNQVRFVDLKWKRDESDHTYWEYVDYLMLIEEHQREENIFVALHNQLSNINE